MRNLFSGIVCAAFLLAGGAPASSGDATFTLANKARFNVMVKVFSQSRHWEWPSTTRHWNLDDDAQHALRISCQDGEKVCYGGSFTADDKTHWGVGFKGDKPCSGCCLTCGSNVSHAWNLTETPRPQGPVAGGGHTIDPGTNAVPVDE